MKHLKYVSVKKGLKVVIEWSLTFEVPKGKLFVTSETKFFYFTSIHWHFLKKEQNMECTWKSCPSNLQIDIRKRKSTLIEKENELCVTPGFCPKDNRIISSNLLSSQLADWIIVWVEITKIIITVIYNIIGRIFTRALPQKGSRVR